MNAPLWLLTATIKHTYFHWTIFNLNSAGIEIRFLVDLRSVIFFSTVLLISFSVFRFSYSYISTYKFFSRFTILLFIFVLSMIILIFASNIIFIMLGWDGLGVSSYLLVIYYGRRKSYNAGMLTVMRNRIGDIALIFSMGLIMQTSNWRIMFYKESIMLRSYLPFLLSLGAFTKSAQIPFSAWLPAAIAAPTPVSSLVHSSTLVTAGVYLLYRNLIDLLFFNIQNLIIFLGVTTILIARIAALNEKDIKKIVALSTLSQLGLIVSRLGCKWVFMTFFHLIIHAFFKAIIFIRVGNLIHLSQNYQALKNRGSLRTSRPFNNSTLILARFRLCGAPFAAAFFSKEPIVELSFYRSSYLGVIFCVLASLYLTLIYRFRLLKLVIINFTNLRSIIVLSEEDPLLLKGIFILLIPSFSRGSILRSIIIYLPFQISYPVSIKFIIFSSLLLRIVALTLRKYPIYYKIQFILYPMWGITLFTTSLFHSKQKISSWFINMSNFSWLLCNYIRSVNLFSTSNSSIIGRSFVIRRVTIIPLFSLLYLLF